MDPMTRDECPLFRSLFEETTGDPWRDVLQPALLGVASLVSERLARVAEEPDPVHRARCQAIGARALYALGRPVGARALLDQALRRPVSEAWALESLVGADPAPVLARRLGSGSPGERADVACDGALFALRRGDTEAARGWVARARTLCPDHGEAERWQAYLDGAGERAVPLLWSFDKPRRDLLDVLRRGRLTDPLLGHLDDLLPRAWQGMFSRERARRRHRDFVRCRQDLVSVSSGLARLRETGRVSRWLAADDFYARVDAEVPQVQVELCLDRARACQAEGRTAWGAVGACWRLAPRLTPRTRARLSLFLVLLALQEPALSGLAAHASGVVLAESPQDPDLLAGRAAALLLEGRTAQAVGLARRSLAVHRGSGLGLVLGLETLRRAGFEHRVRQALRRTRAHPLHGWIADVWLLDLEEPPLDPDVWDLAQGFAERGK